MRLKSILICVTCFCLSVASRVSAVVPPIDRCAFPPGLREEISRTYPSTRLIKLGGLSEYDRKLFQKSHGARCPGMVKVDFYGDGRPTLALILVSENGSKSVAQLVVAHQAGKDWEISSLDSADASAPVVWTQGPGKYRDVYGKKTIAASHPVIVFVGYGGWAIIYAWTGKGIDKVWVAD